MSVDPEIFAFFQHKVERIPHFAQVTEVRHMFKDLRILNYAMCLCVLHMLFIEKQCVTYLFLLATWQLVSFCAAEADNITSMTVNSFYP